MINPVPERAAVPGPLLPRYQLLLLSVAFRAPSSSVFCQTGRVFLGHLSLQCMSQGGRDLGTCRERGQMQENQNSHLEAKVIRLAFNQVGH